MVERMVEEVVHHHRRTASIRYFTGHRKVPADHQEAVGHRRQRGHQNLHRHLVSEVDATHCQAGDLKVLACQRHHSLRQRPFQPTRVPEV